MRRAARSSCGWPTCPAPRGSSSARRNRPSTARCEACSRASPPRLASSASALPPARWPRSPRPRPAEAIEPRPRRRPSRPAGAGARPPAEGGPPPVKELNALLEQNERNLERARGHVANLAHGLKTPLATLAMALRAPGRDPDGTPHRAGGGYGPAGAPSPAPGPHGGPGGPGPDAHRAAPAPPDLREVLLRLHAGRALSITLTVPEDLAVACEGQDLDEMLGNLLDNACRWCRTTVSVSASRREAGVEIRIEMTGRASRPGSGEVIERGRRLDEGVPGDGFGLPITLELADSTGQPGSGRGALGELRARLMLPGGRGFGHRAQSREGVRPSLPISAPP